jgi:predicted TIM-barrel fold metal-dependent hydrolase
LELANPLHLRAVLETPTFARCRVVLLHGSYPFMREASYLASVYPQVWGEACFLACCGCMILRVKQSTNFDLSTITPIVLSEHVLDRSNLKLGFQTAGETARIG